MRKEDLILGRDVRVPTYGIGVLVNPPRNEHGTERAGYAWVRTHADGISRFFSLDNIMPWPETPAAEFKERFQTGKLDKPAQVGATIYGIGTDESVVIERAQKQFSMTGGVSASDRALRVLWCDAGGRFHGPHTETGTMPEAALLPFLRTLLHPPAKVPSGAYAWIRDAAALLARWRENFTARDLNEQTNALLSGVPAPQEDLGGDSLTYQTGRLLADANLGRQLRELVGTGHVDVRDIMALFPNLRHPR